ncbi:MAG: DNA repair protein RadC [Saprospiraceae bacterium]|nr:DNA repair protein RadC [Saprospiraceae bacterium]
MSYSPPTLPIRAWAEEDRPREKMLLRGRQNLSDAELLAILLGSGSRDETAVGLAQRILHAAGNNLHELGKYSITDLISCFKGVGEAKAISIVAALELGRRRQLSDIRERPKVRSSRDAYDAIAPLIADLAHEEFWILLLSRSNQIIGRQQISTGGPVSTIVDAKMVFLRAVEGRAISLVLCHNHPSGTLSPSQADLDLTRKLVQAGKMLDIAVVDHLIISGKGYYSFADEGAL